MSRARRKKAAAKSQQKELKLIKTREQLPEDERFVLLRQSSYPLERGGVYSEMGADMTYEELSSYPNTTGELTHFEQHQEQPVVSLAEIIGFILMLISVFILFVSPLWFSFMTLGIALIARKQKLIGMMTIAFIFTLIGLTFALYHLL